MAPARACIWAILSSARCMVAPASLIDPEMPATASPIRVWASRRGVGGLQRLLAGPERGHLGLEALRRSRRACPAGRRSGVLGLEVGELRGDGRPPAERLAGQVLTVLAEGQAGLVLELGRLLLELVGLDLDPLPGRGHLGDAAAHLLEVLELLLVGEVEGVAGVLDPVEQLVGLGPEDVQKALEDTHDDHPSIGEGHRPVAARAAVEHGAPRSWRPRPRGSPGRGPGRRRLGGAPARPGAGTDGRTGHDRRVP